MRRASYSRDCSEALSTAMIVEWRIETLRYRCCILPRCLPYPNTPIDDTHAQICTHNHSHHRQYCCRTCTYITHSLRHPPIARHHPPLQLENLLIDSQGNLKIADFGVACRRAGGTGGARGGGGGGGGGAGGMGEDGEEQLMRTMVGSR